MQSSTVCLTDLNLLSWKCKRVVCDVLNLVWKTHHYSVKSSRNLKALASELNKEALKTNSTTWDTMVARRQPRVESVYQVGRCIDIRRTNLSLVLCHMEHSSTSSSKGHEKFISKKMRNVQCAAFCHFLADVFSILGKLSLNMQSDDFILPVAVSQLKETVASMSCLKSRHAPNCYLETFLKVPNNLGKKDLKVFQGIELEGNSRVEKSALGQAQISTQG